MLYPLNLYQKRIKKVELGIRNFPNPVAADGKSVFRVRHPLDMDCIRMFI